MKAAGRVLSPAKVNLFLKVISRRADGYHEISSLMQPVSLYDEISISVDAGEGISVRCGNDRVPEGRENLAFKAAELILQYTGIKRNLSIEILKRIPVGAGLGGGSSNAAATLMGLNSILNAGLDDKELMGLGARIGSDVPFFILKSPAMARGRGEVLERVKLPHFTYILINPGFHVSTAWAYNNLDLTKKAEDNILAYSEETLKDVSKIREFLENDLEAVTLRKYPEISKIKSTLVKAGAWGALMSGSGPTVFGIFPEGSASRAFDRLKNSIGKGYSIFLAKGL